MEKYLIYFDETPTSRKYVSYLYRNSISDTKDIGSAIEFDDKQTVINVCAYLNRRERVTKYKSLCIKTTIEEVIE